jgi:hypothetical protein
MGSCVTEVRRILLRALALLLAAVALPQAARACSGDMRYYFLKQPPALTPDIMFVRVTIVSKTMTSVEARLEAPFAALSDNGMIHIVLPFEPRGDNCVDWGDLEGPVYVLASSALVRDGRASIMARPVEPEARRDHMRSEERQVLNEFRRKSHIWVDPDFARPPAQ